MPDSGFQRQFHARRGHLRNPLVRDLAWLLDSPDLLDAGNPCWNGRIASLFSHSSKAIDNWLNQLDEQPEALQTVIERHGFNRLGRYSELLMAFFLEHIGALRAHGLQVRAPTGETVGEFDFLLQDQESRFVHWEFATKFYLLAPEAARIHAGNTPNEQADALVGPNLADSLGAKMRKILARQLKLSQHPAARAMLKEMPETAQALIKGWLFYAPDAAPLLPAAGLDPAHCRGFWCSLSRFGDIAQDCFLILPRLRWLAPARAASADCLCRASVIQGLQRHLAKDNLPVMLAVMELDGDNAVEIERGFIVPDDWMGRARLFLGQ